MGKAGWIVNALAAPSTAAIKLPPLWKALSSGLRKQIAFGAERLQHEFPLPVSHNAIARILRQHQLTRSRKKTRHQKATPPLQTLLAALRSDLHRHQVFAGHHPLLAADDPPQTAPLPIHRPRPSHRAPRSSAPARPPGDPARRARSHSPKAGASWARKSARNWTGGRRSSSAPLHPAQICERRTHRHRAAPRPFDRQGPAGRGPTHAGDRRQV
jgi:hypothetical protein